LRLFHEIEENFKYNVLKFENDWKKGSLFFEKKKFFLRKTEEKEAKFIKEIEAFALTNESFIENPRIPMGDCLFQFIRIRDFHEKIDKISNFDKNINQRIEINEFSLRKSLIFIERQREDLDRLYENHVFFGLEKMVFS